MSYKSSRNPQVINDWVPSRTHEVFNKQMNIQQLKTRFIRLARGNTEVWDVKKSGKIVNEPLTKSATNGTCSLLGWLTVSKRYTHLRATQTRRVYRDATVGARGWLTFTNRASNEWIRILVQSQRDTRICFTRLYTTQAHIPHCCHDPTTRSDT
jgi:hypothetical protein